MIGGKYNFHIRVSEKKYNGNKPVFSDIPYGVVKNQMLALKCYGCLMRIFYVVGRADLGDEVKELLVLAFANSNYDDIKQMFYSNPASPFNEADIDNKSTKKLYSQYSALLKSGANRLTMLCGENWYKHISNGLADIENLKLNCVSSIFNPYNSEGFMNSDLKFEMLYQVLSHTVETIVTLEQEMATNGVLFRLADNTSLKDFCDDLVEKSLSNENFFINIINNLELMR